MIYPTTFPTRRILTVALLSLPLVILSALFLDQSLALFFKQPEQLSLWLLARNITNVGLSEHYFIGAFLLYVFARWIRPQYSRLRTWSRYFLLSLLGSGVLVHLVKFSVGRQRPHRSPDFDPTTFHPFTTHWDFHSFASGHTQVMFTVATMFAVAFPKAKWLFFAVAAFFGFTRVVTHDHFLSDVIGGAVVGYVGTLTTLFLIQRWEKRASLNT